MSVTPMMKQYISIKEAHKDALLLFRLGDFYELFYDDAITAAKILEITLTSRDKKTNPIPMCGVPYHSAKNYIEKLIDHGYKVAICEQMEDPKSTKGMVNREVVRIITPGTLIDNFGMSDGEGNYILSVTKSNDEYHVAYADISTGEVLVFTERDQEKVKSEILKLNIRELVITDETIVTDLMNDPPLTSVIHEVNPHELTFESDCTDEEVHALNVLMTYIKKNNMKSLSHMKPIKHHKIKQYMQLSNTVVKNLELVESIQSKEVKGSLFWYLNYTNTPMGKRKLKKWIERPLMNVDDIYERQTVVETLNDNFIEREDLKNALNHVYDIERLVGRLSFGNIDAKDLVQLKASLESLPKVKALLEDIQLKNNSLLKDFDPLTDVYQMLDSSLLEDPPKTIRDGNIFKTGFNEKLDELKYLSKNGQEWLENYIEKERERTSIKQMKIGYNKVFGYYIEISKANAVNFDADHYDYHRKQTLTNAERFITPELKDMESSIINAQEESVLLEYQLFQSMRNEMMQYIPRLQKTADIISTLDCLIAFAIVTNEYRLERPTFTQNVLNIEEGRHPVVEKVIGENTYVPNSIKMDSDVFMYLITGPNMSGKSTYMRQVAIISIMAQMGMNVPAKKAELPIFDQIFTRIGASDDLASGKSTFMIEMLEANEALTHATKNSLLVFDEIGRGTSTYDGMALAQSMLEYIHNEIGAKTLFSTHYHELTHLESELHGLKNVHVKATNYNDQLVFLHKVEPGAVEQSYGIHVAKLAALDDKVTSRAHEILKSLETLEQHTQLTFNMDSKDDSFNKDKHNDTSKIENELKNLNLNTLTPLEALQKLYDLQSELK